MTRDELNSHLLYQINSKLNGLLCIVADYVITNGNMSNESLAHIRRIINNEYDTLEASCKMMEDINKAEAKRRRKNTK